MSMPDGFVTRKQRTEGSPWPFLLAVGLATSEVGILLGLRPLSVGGLLLFVGSVAGMVRDAGYLVHLDRAVSVQGIVLVAVGVALIMRSATGSTVRGQSIAIAGVLSLLAIPLRLVYARWGRSILR